jgi:hypothetical protein
MRTEMTPGLVQEAAAMLLYTFPSGWNTCVHMFKDIADLAQGAAESRTLPLESRTVKEDKSL